MILLLLSWLLTITITLFTIIGVLYLCLRRPVPSSDEGRRQFSARLMAHRGGAAGALRSRCKALPPCTTPYVVNGIEATVAIPENSMAAFIYSADNGADGWELDTYLTKEGIPVVIHDEIIDRVLQGRGTVGNMTLADLQSIPYKDCSKQFAGERLPTLEDVLILAKQRGMRVMVEIKEKKRKLQMCRMVYQLIGKHDMAKLAYAGCFNPYTLWLFRGLDRACTIETCYIYCNDVSKYVVQNHVNAGVNIPWPISVIKARTITAYTIVPGYIFLLSLLPPSSSRASLLCLRLLCIQTPIGRRALDWAFRFVATPFGLSCIGARIVAMKQDLMTPSLAAYNKQNGIISGAWVVNARRDKARIEPLNVTIITDRLFYANPLPRHPVVAVPSVN